MFFVFITTMANNRACLSEQDGLLYEPYGDKGIFRTREQNPTVLHHDQLKRLYSEAEAQEILEKILSFAMGTTQNESGVSKLPKELVDTIMRRCTNARCSACGKFRK